MSFLGGFLSVKDKLYDGVKDVIGKVRDFLPFSDAKIGPLSDLTESGKRLVETFGKGINSAGPIGFADALLPVGPVPQGVGGLGGGGGGGITLSITIDRIEISAPGGDPQLITAEIGDRLKQEVRQLVEEVDSRIRA